MQRRLLGMDISRLPIRNPLDGRIPVSGPLRRREASRLRRGTEQPRLRVPRPCGTTPTSRRPPRERTGTPLQSSRARHGDAHRSHGRARVWRGVPGSRRSPLRSAPAATTGLHPRSAKRSRRPFGTSCSPPRRRGSLCRHALQPASSVGRRSGVGCSRRRSKQRCWISLNQRVQEPAGSLRRTSTRRVQSVA